MSAQSSCYLKPKTHLENNVPAEAVTGSTVVQSVELHLDDTAIVRMIFMVCCLPVITDRSQILHIR